MIRTEPRPAATNTCRVCAGRLLTARRTVTDVALDWSATTVPCAARERSALAS